MFLFDDPLIRQLLPPFGTLLLALMGYIMRRYLAPKRVEARMSQPSAPGNGNGNGYMVAITSESKRVDDVREDMVRMEARLMDKINWLSVSLYESIDARLVQIDRRIAEIEAEKRKLTGDHK